MKPSIALLMMLAGCSSAPPPEPLPGCNPLIGDDCLTPFPSSFYERADSTAATGVRVAIPSGVLPVSSGGVALRPDRINLRDGFSPSSPFVVYFKAGVNAAQLPTLQTLDQSVTPQSAVQVLDSETGIRVPVYAELDANSGQGDRQALLIRPQVRLQAGQRVIIALVKLADAGGKPLVAPGFAALRDKTALSKALMPLQARTEEIFGVLQKAGVARADVTLAWDVHTGSDPTQTGHLTAMRDAALPMVDSLNWTVTSRTDFTVGQDANRLREIVGTFTVPSWLKDDSLTATIALGPNGELPQPRMGTANFVVDLPQCAAGATAPLPVVVFGHGLFGSAQTELASAYQKQVGNTLCMVQIGTDWIGLSSADVPQVTTDVVPDFNNINIVTDRLQQAHVNAQVLTRLFLKHLKDDPALQVNGKAVTDGSQLYYYGISDGGIQGGTYMALSQDVTRGVLNVPGCEWNLMMFRSADFNGLKAVLDGVYMDQLDQQIGLALVQHEFDYTDPASFATHWITEPFANTPAKKILIQEAINDAQVPNIATRILVRTAGLPGLDLEMPVYGVTEMSGPLASAYTQWDVNPMPAPSGTNTPPKDNQAHGCIRTLPPLVDQLKAFFTPAGQVTQTCNGPCVFPTPTTNGCGN